MHTIKASSLLRLLAGVAFFTCSCQEIHAQYDDGNSDVEDWQLFDEEETDSAVKPRHKEWKNMAYVRYSPSQYTFPGCTPHLHFQEVNLGWARSLQVVDSIPIFVEAGAEVKYSFSAGDKRHGNAKYSLLTFRVPVNVTYKLYLSRTRNIALAPQAGVHFRVIAMGKEKMDGQRGNLFDNDRNNQTGSAWERCQLGWQVGLRLQVERFFITAGYGRDFPDKGKRPQIHEGGITAGMCF